MTSEELDRLIERAAKGRGVSPYALEGEAWQALESDTVNADLDNHERRIEALERIVRRLCYRLGETIEEEPTNETVES